MLKFFGPLESPLQELSTVDGTSIWAGDGVHLTSNATRVAATKLMKAINGGSEPQEPATKRARLESVIPVRASRSTTAKAAQPAPPPAPKPVPPPLWLSGQLPANQRGSGNQRGQRGQPRGGWGGHIERGGQQMAGRGAAPRGAPRGGRPGRWGRYCESLPLKPHSNKKCLNRKKSENNCVIYKRNKSCKYSPIFFIFFVQCF